MGEEYGETAPFLFFTDYQSKMLSEAIGEGRREEFAQFHWQGEVPNPQSIETFEMSKLTWRKRKFGRGKEIAAYYRELLGLRRKLPLFQPQHQRQIKLVASDGGSLLFIHKQSPEAEAGIIANIADKTATYDFPFEDGVYVKVLDSNDTAWGGSGPTLPTLAVKGDQHMLNGFNLSVFLKEPKEGAPVG